MAPDLERIFDAFYENASGDVREAFVLDDPAIQELLEMYSSKVGTTKLGFLKLIWDDFEEYQRKRYRREMQGGRHV